jgi:host factor-I protein
MPAKGVLMARTTMNLQDGFLNQVRKENTEIKMVLLDGSELVGHVRGFDNFTVIVASQATQHLIYKHAIAQIVIPRSNARGAESHESRGHGAGPGSEGRARNAYSRRESDSA